MASFAPNPNARPGPAFSFGGLIALALLALPVLEIAVFIIVGRAIGVLPTLALVVLSVVAGSALMRRQSFDIVRRMQAEMNAGRLPGEAMVHGAMIMLAGVLLIVPGFITDVVGLALFLPPVRDFVWNQIRRRMVVVDISMRAPAGTGAVIDLEAEDITPGPGRQDPDGGPWRLSGPGGQP